jgi:hypothetical protein
MPPTQVNTGKVTDRRTLKLRSLADLRADIDRIEAAANAGTLRRTGNWTTGQVLGHLAAWMSYPYVGFPMKRAPWFVRLIVGRRKNRYLNEAMPSGVRIPGIEGGTVGLEDLTVQEAVSKLRSSIARLESGAPPVHPSPVFGEMTLDEVVRLNLRHAELHLSFLHPEG